MNIYAKSDKTPLIDHLEHIAKTAKKIATEIGLDENIAYLGGILHDIGKCHPDFQEQLFYTKSQWEDNKINIPLRHEISSLLFLQIFNTNLWTYLIDMTISHHKSMKNKNGLLDLIEHNGNDNIFERHTQDWDATCNENIQPFQSNYFK